MREHRVTLCFLILLCLIGASAVTGTAQKGAPLSVAGVKASGKLVMICFPHQDNPFVRVNLAAGPMKKVGTAADFEGVDVDLMAAFAKHLGVELQIHAHVVQSYSELIPALLTGEGDIIASSFSYSPERAKLVAFSQPYIEVKRVIVTRADSTIASMNDLLGKTAAVMAGSSQEERLRGLGVTSFHPADFPRDALVSVSEKEADYALVDLVPASTIMSGFPALKSAFELGEPDRYCFAIAPGNDLLKALDDFLAMIRTNGELQRITASISRYRRKP